MRKTHLLLLTAIMATGSLTFSAQDSSALYKEDERTWWTVEELLDFKKVADAEMNEQCGKDIGCRENLYFQRLDDYSNQYVALDRLEESQFHITSINPEQGTMKVLYFDQDLVMRRMGEEWHDPLRHIFIAWFDDLKNSSEIGRYYYAYPPEQIFSTMPHIVYRSGDENYPSGQEFELSVNPDEMRDNPHGRVSLAVFADQFNSMGYTDYRSCLNDPDYTPGTECRLMLSSDGDSRFMPPRETTFVAQAFGEQPGSDTSGQTEDTTDATAGDTQVKDQTTEGDQEPQVQADLSTETTEQSTAASDDDHRVTTNEIKAPETGIIERFIDTARELPWWFIAIVLVNILAIVWLFWPTHKDSPKISKKPIDKAKYLR